MVSIEDPYCSCKITRFMGIAARARIPVPRRIAINILFLSLLWATSRENTPRNVPQAKKSATRARALVPKKKNDINSFSTRANSPIDGNRYAAMSSGTSPKSIFKKGAATKMGNLKKQWPLEYFAKVIEYLINEKDFYVFYCGAKSDEKTYEEIRTLIKTPLKHEPVNFCGKFSIEESTCLTKKMDLMIGNDSGNLHISSSLNVATIAIYGPMDTKKWGVRGKHDVCLTTKLKCYPCGLKHKCKSEKACLYSITPDIVISNTEQILT